MAEAVAAPMSGSAEAHADPDDESKTAEPPMSDRLMLTLIHQQCLKACEQVQAAVVRKRQELSKDKYVAEKPARPVRTRFRIRRTLTGHYGKIYAINWSPIDETNICSASQDGKLMIWNAHTENKLVAIPLKSAWVMTCAYSPNSTYVSCGGLDNRISIYRLDEHSQQSYNDVHTRVEPFCELDRHEGYISSIRFWDESHLISSSGDSTLLLWDIEKRAAVTNFMDHTADVMSVALWPKKQMFVSVSCDNSAKIWDLRSKAMCVGNFTGHSEDVNCCDWLPDGNAFVTGSDDTTCKLFDIRAYRELISYEREDISCGVTSIKFSKTGKYLFSGYDDPPYLLSWDTLSTLATQSYQPALRERVSCLDMNCSGIAFATGSWDHNIRIWS